MCENPIAPRILLGLGPWSTECLVLLLRNSPFVLLLPRIPIKCKKTPPSLRERRTFRPHCGCRTDVFYFPFQSLGARAGGCVRVLFVTPPPLVPSLPFSLFSGTEIGQACLHPVAYPVISSISACKVGEHFFCVSHLPHYLFSEVCPGADNLALPTCFWRKRKWGGGTRMLHFFHFLPELCSLFLVSLPSPNSLNQMYVNKSG